MTDLLTPRGRLQLLPVRNTNHNWFNETGTLFNLRGDNFHFQLSVDETGLYLERNGNQCILTPDMLSSCHLKFFIIMWEPVSLMIMTEGKSDTLFLLVKNTTPFSVPISFKKWARDQSLIPKKAYDTELDFRSAVYQCLTDLREKIEYNGSSESFWDYSYGGNTIKGKTPKKETFVQPLIKTIIDTELHLRGIDLFRENTTPAGDIDFTVVGSVNGIGIVNMCIELKNGHSKDLENGLLVQLPNYMRSQQSQFGAYCILNYNLGKGNNLERQDFVNKLFLLQQTAPDDLVRTKIKIFIIDLDKNIIAKKQ